jgi:hypothetical protein
MGIMGAAGYLIVLLRYLEQRRGQATSLAARLGPPHPILALALITWPIEMALSNLSGRVYPHYQLAGLPALAILTASFAHAFLTLTKPFFEQRRMFISAPMWLFMLLILANMPGLLLWSNGTLPKLFRMDEYHAKAHNLRDYVVRATEEKDYVFVWGMNAGVNFLAHRRAPSRFSYISPLIMADYHGDEDVEELLADLRQHPPALIIDTSPTHSVPPLDPEDRLNFHSPDPAQDWAALMPIMVYISDHYEWRDTLQWGDWRVYVYTGLPASPLTPADQTGIINTAKSTSSGWYFAADSRCPAGLNRTVCRLPR